MSCFMREIVSCVLPPTCSANRVVRRQCKNGGVFGWMAYILQTPFFFLSFSVKWVIKDMISLYASLLRKPWPGLTLCFEDPPRLVRYGDSRLPTQRSKYYTVKRPFSGRKGGHARSFVTGDTHTHPRPSRSRGRSVD